MGKLRFKGDLDCWVDRLLGHPQEYRLGCLQSDPYVGVQGLKNVIPMLEVRAGEPDHA